ncbi:hypothetical protein ACGFOU_29105 [Streptomyces sp. NPDC048595]|uniref:hypothetical protein n=1 Tax=Streptomyces sp. NPDC048595 TaxID=3365576 RepID=UPI0037215455
MGGIRVSCHWFNSPADVDRLLAAVSGAPPVRHGRRPATRGARMDHQPEACRGPLRTPVCTEGPTTRPGA